ncbi:MULTISPECIES: AMP-binding protein [unclassified Achromobacter]|uniref:AMP-binding protein n=1 Tax=unclassified Achromobacter TaxID=2626865 RepID=UPI000B51506C|nr:MULTISPECIES: AMP-binding protein [unclassified Achromobacter]OWT80055.1 4-chlorobenzoate--CoA ligase [Achromobacter sp. HZ34]OWT81938.1 4-chlorobenzoate--CoA ligase [Achromobacter sp. HZ28]
MLDLGKTFLQSVERNPDAPAIVDGERSRCYAEWHADIAALGEALVEMGLRKGERVLAVLQNRYEMATLHWACQFVGLVMTPLNWRAKPDEVVYCIENAEARVVFFEAVSAAAVVSAARQCRVPAVAVGDIQSEAQADVQADSQADIHTEIQSELQAGLRFDSLVAAHHGAALAPAAQADDYSLMLYTSGTTGKPKGVPRRHRHERAAALAHVAQNLYGRGERTLGVMPLYHTMGVRSLLAMALVDGLFVCMPRFDAAATLEAIARHRLTCLYLVPTLYHDMLACRERNGGDVSSVTKLGFAGAPMHDALLQRLDKVFQPRIFVNHYGSSEIYTVAIDADATRKPGSAGKAGINTRLRVVTLGADDPGAASALAARGVEGEIVADLAGDEAFEGYWKRPDADAKSIRNGWYRTGDTGYVDRDGDLYVTGRVDDMIISGGENISPVDIESVLSLHPAVDEVSVAGMPDERWGQRVVAFVKRKTAVDAAELDRYCQGSDLPNFKRPREYVFVNEIPKSPVGKVLRRKLSAGEYEPDTSTGTPA